MDELAPVTFSKTRGGQWLAFKAEFAQLVTQDLLAKMASANDCDKEFVLCGKGHVVWAFRRFDSANTVKTFKIPEGVSATAAAYALPRDNASHSKLAKLVDSAVPPITSTARWYARLGRRSRQRPAKCHGRT